jgi:hypothetical protein
MFDPTETRTPVPLVVYPVGVERMQENAGMGIDLSSEVPREEQCDQKKN